MLLKADSVFRGGGGGGGGGGGWWSKKNKNPHGKMGSNNMEHPLLNNQMGNLSRNMGFGTCLYK